MLRTTPSTFLAFVLLFITFSSVASLPHRGPTSATRRARLARAAPLRLQKDDTSSYTSTGTHNVYIDASSSSAQPGGISGSTINISLLSRFIHILSSSSASSPRRWKRDDANGMNDDMAAEQLAYREAVEGLASFDAVATPPSGPGEALKLALPSIASMLGGRVLAVAQPTLVALPTLAALPTLSPEPLSTSFVQDASSTSSSPTASPTNVPSTASSDDSPMTVTLTFMPGPLALGTTFTSSPSASSAVDSSSSSPIPTTTTSTTTSSIAALPTATIASNPKLASYNPTGAPPPLLSSTSSAPAAARTQYSTGKGGSLASGVGSVPVGYGVGSAMGEGVPSSL